MKSGAGGEGSGGVRTRPETTEVGLRFEDGGFERDKEEVVRGYEARRAAA